MNAMDKSMATSPVDAPDTDQFRLRRFIERLKLFSHLANVGDAKSLVIHPASTTHARLDAAALERAGISEGLVRLSIGLEDPQDLIDDLARALGVSQK